jgi:FlaA1/EpsC-like NDP-sugar epimerase
MEFSEFQQLIHEIGTAILVLLYLVRLVVLLRRRPAGDLASNPKGEIWRGVVGAFLTFVAPWRMESTRKHWMRYAEFAIFHVGVFLCIALSFVITYAPGVLTLPARAVALVLMAASLLVGGLRLYRRVKLPEMRIISSPDDYLAMGMVMGFLGTGILGLLGWEAAIIAYFVVSALFLIYEPFSKIRHYIYYPFARYYYGTTFGRRGVIGW